MLLFTILLSLSYLSLPGQDIVVDSLQTALIQASDTQRVIVLNQLAYTLYRSNPQQGAVYGKEAARLAEKFNMDQQLGNAYNTLGGAYWVMSKRDSALLYYQSAYQYKNIAKDTAGMAGALSNMGVIYNENRDYLKAIEIYKKALKIMEANNLVDYAAITSNNMGIVYMTLGKYNEASEYFFKAVVVAEKDQLHNLICNAYNNLGKLHGKMKDTEKEIMFKRKALLTALDANNMIQTGVAYNNIGTFHLEKKNYDSAIYYFNKARIVNSNLQRSKSTALNLINLSKVYAEIQRYDSALYYADEAVVLSQSIQDVLKLIQANLEKGDALKALKGCQAALPIYLEAYSSATEMKFLPEIKFLSEALYLCHKDLGRYDEALRFQTEYIKATDSLLNEDNVRRLAELEAEYEFDKERISKNNEIRLLEAERANARLKLAMGLVIAAMILIIAFFIFKAIIAKKERNAANLQMMSEYKQSLTKMIAHDLKNPLSVILSNPSEFPSTKHIAQQMLQLVNNMLDVQKLQQAHVLLSLATINLYEIIHQVAEQIRPLISKKNIHLTVDVNQELFIRADENYLFRVMVNLLTNAIKFSPQNDSIIIHATEGYGSVRIDITDHGPGIPADKLETIFDEYAQLDARTSGGIASTGLGLTFCKLALQALNSQIHVNSVPGKTTFWFELPQIENKEVHTTADGPIEAAFALNQDDINKVQPILSLLRSYKLYEGQKIIRTLDTVDNTDNIVKWKTHLLDAVFTNNQAYFDQLISLATGR